MPHTEDGYKEAKKILEKTYGKDIKIHKALIKELEGLEVISSIHNVNKIHEYYNKLTRIVRTLVTMKKLDSAQSYVYTLVDKLGPVKENLIQKDDDWENWDLLELVENLEKYVDRHPQPPDGTFTSSASPAYRRLQGSKREPRGNDRMLLAKNTKTHCVYCGKDNHHSSECFRILDVAHRKDILKSKNLCFNCASAGHVATKCRSRGCSKCGARHHTSLCGRSSMATSSAGEQATNRPQEKGMRAMEEKTTIHATLVAKINGIDARIMLDSGAGSSYICTSLIRQLGIHPFKTERRVIEQMYGTVVKQVELYRVTVTSKAIDGLKMELKCINGEKDVLTFLANPNISRIKERHRRLRRLQFSDEGTTDCMLPVHIILGAADYQHIKTAEPAVLGQDVDNDPGAEFTMLGWTLSGVATEKNTQTEKTFFVKSSKEEFAQMCSLEVLGLKDQREEEFHCDFMDRLERLSDGTYMTKLPWKNGGSSLPEHKSLALARLASTTRRLQKLGKLEEYHGIMKEQLEQGIIEEIPLQPTGEIVHYVPHQAVVRENAESTKLRIVYDCSAKGTTQEPSLNDLLETGPPLQPQIFDILLRNRLHRYCITGDVQKAFLQIKIEPEDRDALRLLWYKDIEEKTIKEFRFTRVIFGSAPSPYILVATLKKHLEQFREKYPETVKHLEQNTYVDDVQCSADSKEEVIKFKKESIEIMADGGFTLHKWHSNVKIAEHEEKQNGNVFEEGTYAKATVGTKAGETKILGMDWDTANDMIEINFSQCFEKLDGAVLTKIEMLSAINGIFDPLGIAAPVVITGKMLYSKVCLMKIAWDAKLPKEILDPWNRWINTMKSCLVLSIPRSVTKDRPSRVILHGFSDASKQAIAVAVYLVSYYEEIDSESRLLVAKSRIAPRDTSIPPLELAGAHMLSCLLNHVKEILPYSMIYEIYGWVDSTTVLHWLQDQGRWTQFV